MKSKTVKFLTLVILILLTNIPSMAFALPEGATIVSGDAVLDYSTPNALTVNTSSDKLIIEYSAFSIAANEAVYFIQPSVTSAVLNRVTGNSTSDIYGILSANGIIYLVNPNGINIGADAKINAAGFIASTLNISNANFVSDNYVFTKFTDKVGKSIINKGYIKVRENGQVCLLGSAVANSGTIEASLGSVVLAAGQAITLNLDTVGMVSVVIDEAVKEEILGPDGQKLNNAVDNRGKIYANGGRVILTTKVLNNIFNYSVNNSGLIQANSIVNHDGVIELVAEGAPVINTGTMEAGQITISAKNTGYTNIGKVKADGSVEFPAGGKILIEAGTILQQGLISANALENATAGEIVIESETSTTLDTNSTTEAKALGLNGQGGRILINSGGNTVVNKNALIDVSAGAISGNAGFIDISAFAQLGFYGILNGRAPPGYKPTTAILDPFDATVGNSDSLDPDWGATFNADTTIWATNNITIVGNINIGDGFVLSLYADHNSETAGDWEDGVGVITRNGDFTISGFNATLNLKAGNGIGTSDFPIKTNISNFSAEINPASSGDIYIAQGATDLALGSVTTPSGTVNISAEGAILDGNFDSSNINATSLILSAAGGIGPTDTLETSVSYLAAQITNPEAIDSIDIKNNTNLTLSDMLGWGYAIKNAGSGDINITIDCESANLTVNNEVIANSGNINLASYGLDYAYIDIESPITVISGNGSIKLEAITTANDSTETDYYYYGSSSNAEIDVYGAISTIFGDITLEASNNITRDIVTDYISYFEDYTYNYAYIDIESPIQSQTGYITIKATNTLITNINKDSIDPTNEIYEYYDYSDNEAYVYVYGTISTTGNIDISALNNITKDINADHIGYYNGSYYEGHCEDYSYNYAYLDIEDTLDTRSATGDSEGAITLNAINTTNNTLNIADYISEYYYEYSDYGYSNYSEIYVYNYDAIYSDLGDITLKAKNDLTRNITAGYIDYLYDYPDNESYISLYSPIYSQSGNITLEANNSTNNTTSAITDDLTGGINNWTDYNYNYSEVYISDDSAWTVSTTGNIDIYSLNVLTRNTTADYIEYFDDEYYNYAELYTYDIITTARVYDGENLVDAEGSIGGINISATNDVLTDIKVTDYFNTYYTYNYYPYNYAYVYINEEVESRVGDITIKAANTITANINKNADPANEIYEYYDYSANETYVYIYRTVSTTGNIDISASNNITKNINAGYVVSYKDYYYTYAYLNISGILDVRSSIGNSNGTITLNTINTINNTFNILDYISEYYYVINYCSYNNYAELYLSNCDGIYSDLGDINLTAKNNLTSNINDIYIDSYVDDYPVNKSYMSIYSPIYSRAGNITLEANNEYAGDSDNYAIVSFYSPVETVTGDITVIAKTNVELDVLLAVEGSVSVTATDGYIKDIKTPSHDLDPNGEPASNIIATIITLNASGDIGEELNNIYIEITDPLNVTATSSGGNIYIGTGGTNPDSLVISSWSIPLDTWSNNNLVTASWDMSADPGDPSSGIDGYSYVWDNMPYTIPDRNLDIEETENSVSANLGDSGSNYFHIRVKDNAGNWSDAVHLGPFKIDTTAPVITADSRVATEGNNGWWTSAISVHFTASDATSGLDASADLGTRDIDVEGIDLMIDTTGITATDLAGNTTTEIFDDPNGYLQAYNIDKTAPEITSTRTEANSNGWNNTDVTVSFSASDNLSGIDTITEDTAISTEGENQSVTGTARDLAGNESSAIVSGINIDKTAPEILATRTEANTSGWNNSDVTVNYNVTDAGGSGIDESASDYSDDILSNEGVNQSINGYVYDRAGNYSEVITDSINIDKTAPSISGSPTTSANDNGWYNTDVTISFTANDDLSGIDTVTSDITLDNEAAEQSVEGTATDSAGNSTSFTVNGINIDKTAPSISVNRTEANVNGWNNTDVTVNFSAADELSGIDTVSDQINISTEGEGLSTTGTATDKAGNSASVAVENINIDKTAPEIDVTAPLDGVTYATSQTLEYSASDNLDVNPDISGDESGKIYDIDGTYIIDINATDLAGNTASKQLVFGISKPAGTNTTLESQLANSNVFNPLPLDLMNIITQHMGTFNTGGVFFYHPLGTGETIVFQGMESNEEENK